MLTMLTSTCGKDFQVSIRTCLRSECGRGSGGSVGASSWFSCSIISPSRADRSTAWSSASLWCTAICTSRGLPLPATASSITRRRTRSTTRSIALAWVRVFAANVSLPSVTCRIGLIASVEVSSACPTDRRPPLRSTSSWWTYNQSEEFFSDSSATATTVSRSAPSRATSAALSAAKPSTMPMLLVSRTFTWPSNTPAATHALA